MNVDTSGMDELELEQLRQHPRWIAVLSHYHQIYIQSKELSADVDAWVPRTHEVPEIPSEELPGIHGKLIAFGFLKFDLSGRDGGIRYQLTPLGKQGLNTSGAADEDESANESAEPSEVLAFRG